MRTILAAVVSLLTILASASVAADGVRQGPTRLKPGDAGVGRMVADVTLTDIDGKTVRLSDYRARQGLVVAVTSTSCPLSQRYLASLAKLEKAFQAKGIAFLFVDPIKTNSVADARTAIKTHGLQGSYVRDVDGKLVAALGAKSTTEAFLLDPARTVVYRGAVDDQYGLGYSLDAPRQAHLTNALEAFLAGTQPETAATTAPGCELDVSASKIGDITYHNRISRIVQNNCLECHRKGGVAPFSLETMDDVVAHRGMIRKVIERGTMPPWFAASSDGPSLWANDRSLAAAEKADLLAWFGNGQPAGDTADAPRPRQFAGEWQIGEPDVVLQIPQPMPIKATGAMPYQHARIVTTFKEDKWVEAVEIRPTDRAVVHHVLVFVVGEGGLASRIDERTGFFAAYVPGNSAQKYPTGFAKKLPAGATLVFQLHYTPNGTATTDQTRLGLVFADAPPKHIVRNLGVANRGIAIPAQADNHVEHGRQTFKTDIQMLAFMPHLHLRGKAFRYDLVLPDGSKKQLLDVPHYDFNWQLEYRLAEPLAVPAGGQVEITGWYDNSKNNPANPDPSRTVRWGPQTQDEMLIGFIEYYVPSETVGKEAAPQTAEPQTEKGTARSALIAALFKRADRNGDGKVTPDELQRPELFRRLDRNDDGYITLEEAQALTALPNDE